MKLHKLFIITLLVTNKFIAQTGEIKNVNQSGLQLVFLSPEVISGAQNTIDFIRIKDKNSKEVPYALYTPQNLNKINYINFPIVQNITKDGVTSIVVINDDRKTINQLTCIFDNTTVQKSINIYGSNDKQDWFGVLQNHQLGNLVSQHSNQVQKDIDLPQCNYKFFKIEFDNKKSLPIHCNKIGIYNSNINYVNNIELKNFKNEITYDKGRKITSMNVIFDKPTLFSKLEFDIISPFYLRQAKIYTIKDYDPLQKKTKKKQEVFAFELSSKKINYFELGELFEKELLIEIENQDNQPLDINKIKFYQKPKFLLANLNANEEYKVEISNQYKTPNYDIVNFVPEVDQQLQIVKITNFKSPKVIVKNDQSKTKSNSSVFLWISLIIGGFIIAYFTINLLKDVNKK